MHNTLVIMWPPCQEEWRHEVSLLDCLARLLQHDAGTDKQSRS